MHEKGEAIVVPVILRPVDWHSSAFGKLQALPKDGKPVATLDNQDVAFVEIATGIRKSEGSARVSAGLAETQRARLT
jgi:hypothetical protein